MPIVNYLVDDLIYQHEVLADGLLVQNAAEIAENLHHTVQNVQHVRRRHVVLSGGHEKDSKFLGIEIIDSIHILDYHLYYDEELQSMEEDHPART